MLAVLERVGVLVGDRVARRAAGPLLRPARDGRRGRQAERRGRAAWRALRALALLRHESARVGALAHALHVVLDPLDLGAAGAVAVGRLSEPHALRALGALAVHGLGPNPPALAAANAVDHAAVAAPAIGGLARRARLRRALEVFGARQVLSVLAARVDRPVGATDVRGALALGVGVDVGPVVVRRGHAERILHDRAVGVGGAARAGEAAEAAVPRRATGVAAEPTEVDVTRVVGAGGIVVAELARVAARVLGLEVADVPLLGHGTARMAGVLVLLHAVRAAVIQVVAPLAHRVRVPVDFPKAAARRRLGAARVLALLLVGAARADHARLRAREQLVAADVWVVAAEALLLAQGLAQKLVVVAPRRGVLEERHVLTSHDLVRGDAVAVVHCVECGGDARDRVVEGVEHARRSSVDLHAVADEVDHHLLVRDGVGVQQPVWRLPAVGLTPRICTLEAQPARAEQLGGARARVDRHVPLYGDACRARSRKVGTIREAGAAFRGAQTPHWWARRRAHWWKRRWERRWGNGWRWRRRRG